MLRLKKHSARTGIMCCFSILISGCTTISVLTGVKQPELKVSNVRLSDISFDKANLLLDVAVHNPNNFSIRLDGFDYDLVINDTSFLKGGQESRQTVEAQGNSNVEIPIGLGYKNLYDTYQSLHNSDNVDYDVLCDLHFDLPVVGKTTFPLSDKGSLPLLKIPVVKFDTLKLDDLSLTSADLKLNLIIENPNSFDMVLNNFNYDLDVDGAKWAKSVSDKITKISRKGSCVFSIPVSLNFLTMGRTVYKSLTETEPLEYHFSGKMDMNTSIPMMKELVLPVERTGKISISR